MIFPCRKLLGALSGVTLNSKGDNMGQRERFNGNIIAPDPQSVPKGALELGVPFHIPPHCGKMARPFIPARTRHWIQAAPKEGAVHLSLDNFLCSKRASALTF